MKHLLTTAAAVVLLAACGNNKDKPEAGLEKAEKAAASVSIRSGDASEAGAALTALSLNESGAGRITFGDKSINGATAEFSDVVITVEDGEEPIKAAKLTLEGLETEDNGEANFGRMLLETLSVESDDEDSDSGMTIDSIELVNPSKETAAWVASLLGKGEPADFPDGKALAFDTWSVNALNVTIDEEDESGSFGVSKLVVNGMTDEKAGSAVLSGLKLDMTDDNDDKVMFNLDALNIEGADLKFISALQNAGDDEEEMAAALMDVMYDNPVDPGFDTMTLSNLSANIAGASFDLPSLDYTVSRDKSGQPSKLTLKPFTMKLKADADGGEAGGELAGALGMIGYETLELSGEGLTEYDAEKDIVSYEAGKNYLALKDGFKLSYGGKLGGYKAYSAAISEAMSPEALAAGAPSESAMENAFGKLTVHGFELKLEDDSLVDRLFNLAAAQSGEDPQQMRNQLLSMMAMAPMMASGAGVDMELVTEASTALSGFIADPKTLTLKIDPKEPVNIGALIEAGDPSVITKESLGFSATNK